jgi:abortive infection bacteriophage resistance protein
MVTDPVAPLAIAKCPRRAFLLEESKMPTIQTTKPFLTYPGQLELLKSRGLVSCDETGELLQLRDIGYYRLSAYSLTLRENDIFQAGTTFDDIMELYRFDERLRHLVMKFSPIVEHSVRSYISYSHAKTHGSLGYLNNQHFVNELYHAAFISRLLGKLEKSSEPAMKHHKDDLNGVYPFWVAIEGMSFDMLSQLYSNMLTPDKKVIAGEYYGNKNLYRHIGNWLHCCVNTRNTAAHGARFYNRIFNVSVLYKQEHSGKFKSNTPFAHFYALYNLLPSVSEKTEFVDSLKALLNEYPLANPRELGFPINWMDILAA